MRQEAKDMRLHFIGILFYFLILTGCESVAIYTTPEKKPVASHNALASKAEDNFWRILHAGQYQQIPEAERLLTAAYLKNPNDPKLAAHLGFLHIWNITERERRKTILPTITNEIILAKYYFKDATVLDPSDARYLGFLGDAQLVTGDIFKDEREQTRGYFILKRAISAWPEFNYFTAGYPMSKLPAQSDYYQTALEWQWKTLDLCAGEKINRQNPSFKPFMYRETLVGDKRACWNSWIAPYNFEGFFLNMGDMLVKAGDVQTAIKIYNNAKLDKSYSTWPYKNMLEKRIVNAKANVQNFQKPFISSDKTILFNSGYGCMACHQQSQHK